MSFQSPDCGLKALDWGTTRSHEKLSQLHRFSEITDQRETKRGDGTACDQSDLDSALDLMRRLPPNRVEENLANLIELAPHLTEELLSAVDQPLKVQKCKKTGKEYLLCDYNRDGDSYRSPWSNEFDPPLPDGAIPSPKLRKIEVAANEAFDTYRELYYEGGVSSVYMWDLEEGFASVVLIKKVSDDATKVKGAWDSIHVIEVVEKGGARSAHYKLTSTVLLYMSTNKANLGGFNLSGSLTRQAEQDCPLDSENTHITNIGRLVEDMELRLRGSLQDVYFGKTRDIVNELRSVQNLQEVERQKQLQQEIRFKIDGSSKKDGQ
ncbi:F-actin capping protein, beta subunit [Gonapodya prolifera JEL478]|uniref:F-actin-capping protein subunit beta n=1 Tax=Gonapodya prolifera (strain JEL478) TaxID=1344416 RepID=A0A139AMB6_GONPJ|nr:F-actin capping protein, beta subunit [Gonapodya prolifera JEL478]|eukprot:KXS17917.1 F-actin capping protein, beta subunit [Gonapodya prolifera JEL478]